MAERQMFKVRVALCVSSTTTTMYETLRGSVEYSVDITQLRQYDSEDDELGAGSCMI